MDIKKVILTITTIGVIGISGTYLLMDNTPEPEPIKPTPEQITEQIKQQHFIIEEQITTFKEDFELAGGSKTESQDILDYFKGERGYITWEEMQEWIKVSNTMKDKYKITDFGEVKGGRDFIKKINFLIYENGEEERAKLIEK